MRELVRKEVGALKDEVAALRASHVKLEREVALLRGGEHVEAAAPSVPYAVELAQKVSSERKNVATHPSSDEVPVLWHNPACSKSRAALSLLEERGLPFEIREYLEQPPSVSELSKLQAQLRLEPIDWARTMDSAWCEYFDHVTPFDDLLPEPNAILQAMAEHPIMIERPILTRGGRAIIGRPPERILELLGE